MKRNKLQRLWNAAVLLMVGAAIMSCSQDDVLSCDALPDGKYPLTLTASIDGASTRAVAGKDTFEVGNEIGVRLGTDDDAVSATYKIDSDGVTLIPATTTDTIFWQALEATTITAWYPYELTDADGNKATSVDISDQSSSAMSDFSDIDFLTATAKDQTVGNVINLKFKHQMAKVTFTLFKGADVDLSSVTVTVAGYTSATWTNGVLTGATVGDITPYYDSESETYEVLLVPQDMSGVEFIKVTASGTTYIYTPTSANLEAGCSYTFNITVGDASTDEAE